MEQFSPVLSLLLTVAPAEIRPLRGSEEDGSKLSVQFYGTRDLALLIAWPNIHLYGGKYIALLDCTPAGKMRQAQGGSVYYSRLLKLKSSRGLAVCLK